MIKAARDLTRVLGKLNITCLVKGNYLGSDHRPLYGLFLREAKSYVDDYLDKKAGSTTANTF